MNTTTAAAQANVTVATIRTWCRRNVIAAAKTAGRWVIDAASLTHRIALATLKTRKKAPAMTEAAASLPWDDDHPEAADLNRLIAGGYTAEQILAALGSDAQGMGRYRSFNGRSRRWLDNQLTSLEIRAERAAAQQVVNLTTPRQVDYILSLLAQRDRDGEEGGFMTGPTDRAGIERMTRREASTYIDSLKGTY